MTFEDLFPGYRGVMPPVESVPFRHQLQNFETFGGERITNYSTSLVRRDHIIFGVPLGWNVSIRDPCNLFHNLKNICIAFDTNKHKWFTLDCDLSRKLGVSRRFDLLVARDQVAATHVTTLNNSLYREAHIRACKEANDRVDIVEGEQVELLNQKRTTPENSTREIKDEYSSAYNRAFMLHLHLRGEYNIHGHRERHP